MPSPGFLKKCGLGLLPALNQQDAADDDGNNPDYDGQVKYFQISIKHKRKPEIGAPDPLSPNLIKMGDTPQTKPHPKPKINAFPGILGIRCLEPSSIS